MSAQRIDSDLKEAPNRISLAKIAIGTVIAIVAAFIVNVIVYWLADGAGAFPDDVQIDRMNGDKASLGVLDILTSTIFAIVIAGIVFAIISRFSSRPVRIFWWVATVALVVSFLSPFSIKDAPGDMILALLVMHVLSGIIAIGVLTRAATS